GSVQIENFGGWNQFEPAQGLHRAQRAGLLQKCLPPAVNELKRLDYEFNFTNSSAAQLAVSPQILRGILFNPAVDRGNLIEQIRGGTARINKRLVLTQKFVGQLSATGDSTRLD